MLSPPSVLFKSMTSGGPVLMESKLPPLASPLDGGGTVACEVSRSSTSAFLSDVT